MIHILLHTMLYATTIYISVIYIPYSVGYNRRFLFCYIIIAIYYIYIACTILL